MVIKQDHISSHTKFALAGEHTYKDKLRQAFKELKQTKQEKIYHKN